MEKPKCFCCQDEQVEGQDSIKYFISFRGSSLDEKNRITLINHVIAEHRASQQTATRLRDAKLQLLGASDQITPELISTLFGLNTGYA